MAERDINVLSSIDNVLRDQWAPDLVDAQRKRYVLLDVLKKRTGSTVMLQGPKFSVPLQTGSSEGYGYGTANGALPYAGIASYDNVYYTPAYLHAKISLTQDDLDRARAKKDPEVLVTALESQKSVISRAYQDEARVLHGDGSGKICTFTAVANSGQADIVLDSEDALRNLRVNMYVDVYKADTTTKASAADAYITAINESTLTITLSANLTAATDAGSAIYRRGAKGLEAVGLSTIINNTGTCGLITRGAGFEWWNSYVYPITDTRPFSHMEVDACIRRVNNVGGKTDIIITNDYVQRAFLASEAQKLLKYAESDVQAGYRGLGNVNEYYAVMVRHGGRLIPWIADPDCPSGVMYGIDTDHLFFMETGKAGWMDNGMTVNGVNPIMIRVPGTPTFEAAWRWYHQLCTDHAATQWKITGLEELREV